jgi:long-chain fatty acid transport protein
MNSCRTKFYAKAAMGMLVALLFAQQVFAGGFSIYEQGARATAQAGATVARPWDASAGFYNPGGLAFYSTPGQYRIYVGITPVQSLSKFSGTNPSPGLGTKDKAVTKWFPPFDMYAFYQINDKMNAGIAINTPFGLGTEWDNSNGDYSGRFRSIEGDIQAVFVSPTFSYKINEMFGVGVSLSYVYSKVLLRKNNPTTLFDGTTTRVYDAVAVKLTGEDKASLGYQIGLYAKVNDKLSFGLDYKGSVKNDYKGTARFKQITHEKTAADTLGFLVIDPAVAATLANPLFGGLKQKGNTSVEFPASLVVGVAYKPMDKLSVELDFGYVWWSVFDKVVIKFPEQRKISLDPQINGTPADNSVLEENYKDAWQIRLGAEYDVNDKLQVRCGYIFDKTPAPVSTINPLLPDANRNDIGIGFGYKINDAWHVDAAYMAVIFSEADTKGKNVDDYNGVYNSHVNLFSLNFGYTFGGK